MYMTFDVQSHHIYNLFELHRDKTNKNLFKCTMYVNYSNSEKCLK